MKKQTVLTLDRAHVAVAMDIPTANQHLTKQMGALARWLCSVLRIGMLREEDVFDIVFGLKEKYLSWRLVKYQRLTALLTTLVIQTLGVVAAFIYLVPIAIVAIICGCQMAWYILWRSEIFVVPKIISPEGENELFIRFSVGCLLIKQLYHEIPKSLGLENTYSREVLEKVCRIALRQMARGLDTGVPFCGPTIRQDMRLLIDRAFFCYLFITPATTDPDRLLIANELYVNAFKDLGSVTKPPASEAVEPSVAASNP